MPEANSFVESFRQTAIRLARLGGTVAQNFRGTVTVERKADDSPVTQADRAAQQAIVDELSRCHPDHAVLAEETLDASRHGPVDATGHCWVIDPIDGTRNFARGAGFYCTSVALLHNGHPIAGAIYEPATDRTWSAARDGGAWLNEHPIHVADRPLDGDSTVALSTVRGERLRPAVRTWMEELLFRNVGSVCLHLAWVAQGLMDGAFATRCKLWDIAAGALLIAEAGGRVTNHDGRPLWPVRVSEYRGEDVPIIAGAAAMHSRLLQTLRAESEYAK